MKLHHVALLGAVYMVYHLTLLPSVPGGDSGELLGNSCVFGISHPPGYPLFSLLSYLAGMMTFVPRMYLQGFTLASGDTDTMAISEYFSQLVVVDHNPTYAWKVNHMCAVLASLAVLMIAKCSEYILQLLQDDRDHDDKSSTSANNGGVPPSAVFGAVLFAFSPLAWEYASQSAEVFALNNFICACMLLFTCKVATLLASYYSQNNNNNNNNNSEKKRDISRAMLWTVYCGALFSGLAFANQHASLIFLVVLIPAVVYLSWPVMAAQGCLVSLFVGSFAAFLAGLGPYVLQVYLARVYPAKGSWGNLDDWQGILTHVFRAEYGTFKLGVDRADTEGFVERIWLYLQHTSAETFHTVFPLLLLSVAVGNYSYFSPQKQSTSTTAAISTKTSPKGGISLVEQASNLSESQSQSTKNGKASATTTPATSPATTEAKANAKKGGGNNNNNNNNNNNKKGTAKANGKNKKIVGGNGKNAAAGSTSSPRKEDSNDDDFLFDVDVGSSSNNNNNNTKKKKEPTITLMEKYSKGASSSTVPTVPKAVRRYDGRVLYNIFLGTWLFYILVWHGVLSNLPLNAPMPFIVHARFWIQPHIILCTLAGVGAAHVSKLVRKSVVTSSTTTSTFAFAAETMEYALLVIVFAMIVKGRYAIMDRSKSGWIMHTYGEAILDSLPRNSLLLSHTDLDWNPTRYLRECEHYREDTYEFQPKSSSAASKRKAAMNSSIRRDVTHMNFQMIAYPWFKTMQAPLYPHVVLPRVDFAGISTDKMSEGNAILITNTVVGNRANMFTPTSIHHKDGNQDSGSGLSNKATSILKNNAKTPHAFTGGIYIDMQGVNDVEIEEGGKWRGLTLLPWGVVYRVLGPMEIRDMEPLHLASYEQFRQLQDKMGKYAYDSDTVKDSTGKSSILFQQYPDGSWEFAALSVYNDAQMQLGLNLLTYAIEVQKKADLSLLPILLDRLYTASTLLLNAHRTASRYGCLSHSQSDLQKNTAMAWMRMQGILGIALQFKDKLIELSNTQPGVLDNIFPHNSGMLDDLINSGAYSSVLEEATEIISTFTKENPGDRDRETFQTTVNQMRAAYLKLHSLDEGAGANDNNNNNSNQQQQQQQQQQAKKETKSASASSSNSAKRSKKAQN